MKGAISATIKKGPTVAEAKAASSDDSDDSDDNDDSDDSEWEGDY